MKIELPLKLYFDSKVVISIAHNPAQHERTKHIEIGYHLTKKLTKNLARPVVEHLISKMDMIDIYGYAPT